VLSSHLDSYVQKNFDLLDTYHLPREPRKTHASHLSSRCTTQSPRLRSPIYSSRRRSPSAQIPPVAAAHRRSPPPTGRPPRRRFPGLHPRSSETLEADPPIGRPGDDAAPSSPRGQRAVPSSGGPRCSSPDPAPARPRASKL
jgi:hypothetical protein